MEVSTTCSNQPVRGIRHGLYIHLKVLGTAIVRKLVDLGIFLETGGKPVDFLCLPIILSYHLPDFNPGRTIRPKMDRCPLKSPFLVSLFTMKHFLKVDNEVILLSNGRILYY
jgi:hypothetical protein